MNTPNFTIDLNILDIPEGTKWVTQDRDGQVDFWRSRPVTQSQFWATNVSGQRVGKVKCSAENSSWHAAIVEWPITAGHPHADKMAQYAEDARKTDKPWELWEVQDSYGPDWRTLTNNPWWFTSSQYRRKPQTININGHDVPMPLREAPKEMNTPVYMPSLTHPELFQVTYWHNLATQQRHLRDGILHMTIDAAVRHAKALLLFTVQPGG